PSVPSDLRSQHTTPRRKSVAAPSAPSAASTPFSATTRSLSGADPAQSRAQTLTRALRTFRKKISTAADGDADKGVVGIGGPAGRAREERGAEWLAALASVGAGREKERKEEKKKNGQEGDEAVVVVVEKKKASSPAAATATTTTTANGQKPSDPAKADAMSR